MLERLGVLGLVLVMALQATPGLANQFVSIGTAGVSGVYYPVGGAICRLVNQGRKYHAVRCSVESTTGSVFNINSMRDQKFEFAIVQSDVQQAAIEGMGAFSAYGPFQDMRAVFSIHVEPLHIMVRASSGLKSVEDAKGKTVSIGSPGSGTRVLAETLMRYQGLRISDFAQTLDVTSSEQAAALCDGKVDAVLWTAGIPNSATLEAASTCDVELLPLTGQAISRLLAENPAYVEATIPGGLYPGNEQDVRSLGPKATFVTNASMPDDVVYAVVKAVFEHFADFKKQHPALDLLNEEDMINEGLIAELHPGALRYYQERNWR